MLRLLIPLALLAISLWIIFYEVTGRERHKLLVFLGRGFLVVVLAAILLFIGTSLLGALHHA